MLKAFQEMVRGLIEKPAATEDHEKGLRLATAALLVEVAKADYTEQVIENEVIFELLRERFDLSAEEAEMLLGEGYREVEESVSLQGFTRLLHERLAEEEKHQLIEMLWQVALADDHLDRYEDYLVRKISELLYVSQSDLVRLRNRVTGH